MPKRAINRLGNTALIGLCLALLSACATPRIWLAQKGRVVDWQTQKPIEGAVIVALWLGSVPIIPAESLDVCYHVESATSDGNGYFRLPTYADGHVRIVGRYISVLPYKAGYKESLDERNRYRVKDGVYYMEKDLRNREERLRYLENKSIGQCFTEKEKAFLLLNRALYAEAKSIAKTKSDQEIVQTIKFYLDILEVGRDKAYLLLHDEKVTP